ncbi:hypothetical protein IJ843_08250 [bacterium]|nr:hypothetical protein [bacterium]
MLNINPAAQAPKTTTPQCNCKECCCQAPVIMPSKPDTFEMAYVGIVPPKTWKPDPYAGLGPELSPQEKLKKKWEDVRKPMYATQPQTEASETPQKKSFGQKVVDKVRDFGQKVKNFVTNLFHKNKTEG